MAQIRLLALAFCIFLGCKSKTYAQWSQCEVPWQSVVTEQYVAHIVAHLKLTNDQMIAIDALVTAHRYEFEAFAKLREPLEGRKLAFEALSPDDRRLQVSEYLSIERDLAKAADRQAALNKQFDEQLRLLLTAEQVEAWTTICLEQMWRDVRFLRGLVPRAVVNVSEIAREVMSDDDTMDDRVAGILLDYDELMAQALGRARAAAVERARSRWRYYEELEERNRRVQDAVSEAEAIAIGESYTRRWSLRQRDANTPLVTMRQINIEFTDRIAEILPAVQADEFRRCVEYASYPLAFPDRPLAAVFAQRARELPELTSDQASRIDEIMFSLSGALGDLAKEAVRREEEAFNRWWSNPLGEQTNAQRFQSLQSSDASRKKLDQSAMTALGKVLTEEQRRVIRLPEVWESSQ